MSVSPRTFTVKIRDLIASISDVLEYNVAGRRTLLSITGKLSFVAGLALQIRPFLRPLWAVSAGHSANDGTPQGTVVPAGPFRKFGLPNHMVT